MPRLPLALLSLFLPRPERDEILTDLAAEYAERARVVGERSADRWLWRQALQSAPPLLRWLTWRDRTGYEPRANAFRPGVPMLATLMSDARYAFRRLAARPGYTLLSILTLALGIGGTAAVFGIARPVLLEPLPYANADDVGTFWFGGSWNEQEFTHVRDQVPGFRQVAMTREMDVTMRDGDAPARLIPTLRTSWELFDVLGATPLMGRRFQDGDDASTAEPVLMLSYGLWQELGGSRDIVGSRITVDGTPRTVVGVMPRKFWYPDPGTRLWMTWPINPEGQNGSWTLVGHVAAGNDVTSLEPQLQQFTRMLGERFEYDDPQWDKTRNPEVTPLREELLGGMRPALLATFVAMALILLIACANVSALMLGQVEGRATEMAVRSALGASRRRIIQQLVVEALLIGAGAGVAGATLAALGFNVLAHALPLGTWADAATFDWMLFAVALALAIVAVLLVVLVPTIAFWRGDVREGLHRARTSGIQGRGGRLERGLVVAQVALAMLIASGAALLVRSVGNLYAIDPGFEPEGVVVVDLIPSAELTNVQRRQTIEAAIEELKLIPGVRSAAAGVKLPLRGGGNSFGIQVQGRPELPSASTFFRDVTRGYHETLGIRVIAGRTFDISDQPGPELPVVINQALADRYFPGENPLGRILEGGYGAPQRIIGVVENVAEGALTDSLAPTRYFLAGTVPWWVPVASLVIKVERPADAAAVLDAAREVVNRVAPTFAIQGMTTMERVFDEAVGPARQVMMLLTLLSGLALVLGAIGIYGVISHFALRRQRDWAIRVALGLPGSRVVQRIVGQGATLVIIGVLLGAIGTFALTRVLESMLYEVSKVDPLAFAAAAAALLVIGVIAAFLPAWRTGSVDPALVLREQ